MEEEKEDARRSCDVASVRVYQSMEDEVRESIEHHVRESMNAFSGFDHCHDAHDDVNICGEEEEIFEEMDANNRITDDVVIEDNEEFPIHEEGDGATAPEAAVEVEVEEEWMVKLNGVFHFPVGLGLWLSAAGKHGHFQYASPCLLVCLCCRFGR